MEANSVLQLPPPQGSSIAPPKWLLFGTVLLLALRLVLFFMQPPPVDKIHWSELSQAAELSQVQKKPILYVFTADWSIPCKTMERTAFANNKQVIALINDKFVPVRVEDEESRNSSQTSELLKRYNIGYLPSLVATAPDGTLIRQANSYSGARLLVNVLNDFVADADYTEAKIYMRQGDYARAHELFQRYLDNTHWASSRSSWAAIFNVLCLRIMGESVAAEQSLQAAIKHHRALEYAGKAILDYLSGNLPEERLYNRVYRKEDSVSYHFAVGMNQYALKEMDASRRNLQWVVDNAETGNSERQIATAVLQRI